MTSSDSLTDKLNITPPKGKCNSVALLHSPHIGDPSLSPSTVARQAIPKDAISHVGLHSIRLTRLTYYYYMSYNSLHYGRGTQN